MYFLLDQGVTLVTDTEKCDYYALIPLREHDELDLGKLDKDLLWYGLERLDEEECESEILDFHVKIYLADVLGGATL